MNRYALTVLAGFTVALSSCGTSTDIQISPDASVLSPDTVPQLPVAAAGPPIIAADGFVLTRFHEIAPPADMPEEGRIAAFGDAKGASIVIVVAAVSEVPDDQQGIFRTDDGSIAAQAQVIVLTSDTKYTVTASNIVDSADLVQRLANLLSASGLRQIPMEMESRSFAPLSTKGTIGPGYAVDYSTSRGSVSLLVYPISGQIDVAATTTSSATSFVSFRDGLRYVEPVQVSGDLPQVRWVEGGYLLQLVGSNSFELANKTVHYSGTLAELKASIDSGISAMPLTGTAELLGLRLDRHADREQIREGVCLTDSSGGSSCTEFAAVRSFAQVRLGDTSYLVAIVPEGKPTTQYRTDPRLRWSSATVNGSVYSIAEVEKGIGSVSLFYTTEGVAPIELETVFHFGTE